MSIVVGTPRCESDHQASSTSASIICCVLLSEVLRQNPALFRAVMGRFQGANHPMTGRLAADSNPLMGLRGR